MKNPWRVLSQLMAGSAYWPRSLMVPFEETNDVPALDILDAAFGDGLRDL